MFLFVNIPIYLILKEFSRFEVSEDGVVELISFENTFQASDNSKAVETGKTKYTNATFDKLQASTNYVVQVSVVTTGGWDPSNYLAINLSTSATGETYSL